MMSYRDSNTLILSLLLLALWPANGLSQQPQTNQPLTENENPQLTGKRNINKQQINLYSADKEIALGRRLAAEIEQQSKILNDAGVTDYLARLGQNLALNSDATIPIFSAHPPPLERISKVKDLIARFPEREKQIITAYHYFHKRSGRGL